MGELPAFSQNVIEINKKLSSLHALNFSSAGELANVILKDMSLTNKLLKIVNSSFYSNVSGKVTTISRAVFLLGAEKVRMAAASLMILDHMQDKNQSADLKDASVFSFFSAVIAKDLAEKLKFGSPEEVFICALLHNLGKHLVICYFPEEYEEIKNVIAIKDLDEQSASKSVLGISFSELGMGVTRSWSFPQRIIDSMDVINNEEPKASKNEADVLKNLANYASELCSAAAQTDAIRRNQYLQTVSDKYKIGVPLPLNLTMNLIHDASNKINQYAELFRIDKSKSPLLQRLTSYREEKTNALSATESSLHESATPDTEQAKELSKSQQKIEMLKGCINEINEVLKSSGNIGNSIYMIMETMYRGFEFNRVLFCMLDQKQTRMAARFGFGENIDIIQRNFEFKVTRSSDFFNIAVMRMKDIIIDDSQVPRVKENLPDWYSQLISTRSFLIFPLIIKEKCIGLLYADKKSPGILNDVQKYYMNILRDKAIWAILHKR